MVYSPGMATDLKKYIAEVPDFPKPGVTFKDLSPLLANPEAFTDAVTRISNWDRAKSAEAVVAPEARGFTWGAAVAMVLKVPFIPVRKPGKLPRKTVSATYALEYGTDTLQMHVDALVRGQKALIVDDVLATGGTAEAIARMVEEMGAVVNGLAFVVELNFLKGRDKVGKREVLSLVSY